ncbi:hypothetical protein E1264_04185 [Actinomadura sp. KC216]|uniref:hypothetical protein n=1 Tax=Actinomadura sp. KC216 TaxID=2530370 RepID=UPI00105129ED|nr:hypothetical protein [Actinomadura sp. KC216]TDB90680.1 hypothetical protein E1264_04185 [Actinomadura sp. KC216]
MRAVTDPYALYCIALGHAHDAAQLRERTVDGRLTLVITTLAMVSASGLAGCGERCGRAHPADITPSLRELADADGAELRSLTPPQAAALGALYRTQTAAGYLGDTVLAACGAALVAHAENIPLLTTPRARYCYVTGRPASLATRIEIDSVPDAGDHP